MKPRDAKDRLLKLIATSGIDLDALAPEVGLEMMLLFYRDERVDGCPFDCDGDMLLYQWGVYDWGQGRSFEWNITRQFLTPGDEEDEIDQLSLTFRFSPATVPSEIGSGNRWCRTPEGLTDFREFIKGSLAYLAIERARPESVSLTFGEV